jgi:hypothetical protein
VPQRGDVLAAQRVTDVASAFGPAGRSDPTARAVGRRRNRRGALASLCRPEEAIMTRCTILIAATLLCAAPALAQISESEASKNLKSGLSVRMKADLATLKAEQKTFLSALKEFNGAVKGGGYSFSLLQDLFFDYQLFLDGVTGTVRTSGYDTFLVGQLTLASYANGANLHGEFPEDFYFGTGGPMDVTLDKVYAAQLKTIASVAKKLKSTRGVLEKSAGVYLTTVQRGTPAQPNAYWFSESLDGWTGADGAMTLDTVWGVSEMGSTEDGTLLVAGSFRTTTGDVDVSIDGPESHAFTGTNNGGMFLNRWVAVFDNGGSGLAEGNYVVTARKPSAGPYISMAIGIR